MRSALTHRELARQASYIAREASGWAGDALGPLDSERIVRPEVLQRFTCIRERLDRLERWQEEEILF